jgi:hypothetical protein
MADKKTSKKQKLPGVKQNLKFIGILTFGLTLSLFFIVSGLASLYSPIRQKAYERGLPFILVGEPAESSPSPVLEPEEPKELENLEQVRARMFSTRPEDLAIADLNKDGIVNIADYLLAREMLNSRHSEAEPKNP